MEGDLILVRCEWADLPDPHEAVAAVRTGVGATAVSEHWSDEAQVSASYFPASTALAGTPQIGERSRPLSIEVSRLALRLDLPGEAAGRSAPFHYVVHTDVTPGWEDEIERWYDEEHLPGLAAVAGNARARRFASRQDGPRFYACYELEAPLVLGSPPWLAVRGTSWSSRVRPQFRNTRRTMFRTLDAPEGGRS